MQNDLENEKNSNVSTTNENTAITNEENSFKGVTTKKAGALKPALRSIPRRCLERSTSRGMLVAIRAVVLWVASIVVLMLGDNPLVLIAGWIFASLALAGMFVVGHDAAHNALVESKKLNKIIARLLFLPELHSYEAWLLGHNRLHHGHTVREQMDFVWHPSTVEDYKNMSSKEKLLHKLEWSFIGSGFYYVRNVWWNKMIAFTPPERYRDRIRKDTMVVALFAMISYIALFIYGAINYSSILGGGWMFLKVAAIPWFGFMTIIGWTVYVHHISPSIRWWPRSQWDSYKGQIEGTTILHINPIINWLFFHNIFVHVPHHVDMRIPLYHLPEAGRALSEEFPGIINKKFSFKEYVSGTKVCKLYDFNDHTWHDYQGNITALP